MFQFGDFYEKKELAKFEDRLNMLKIACDKLENIEVSDIEKDANKRLYAIDIFKIIKEKYKKEEIFFIMGADNFANITNWKKSYELTKDYKYIVLDRENIDIMKYIEENQLNKDNIIVIKNEEHKLASSSKFRNMKKMEKCIQNVIPDNVYNYIIENKLF